MGNDATKPHHQKEMVASGGRESWIREHVGCKELRGVEDRSTHYQFRQPTEGPPPWATLADLRPSRGTPYGTQEHSILSDSWPVKPPPSQASLCWTRRPIVNAQGLDFRPLTVQLGTGTRVQVLEQKSSQSRKEPGTAHGMESFQLQPGLPQSLPFVPFPKDFDVGEAQPLPQRPGGAAQ